MPSPREELERLRKLKRLKELDARATGQTTPNQPVERRAPMGEVQPTTPFKDRLRQAVSPIVDRQYGVADAVLPGLTAMAGLETLGNIGDLAQEMTQDINTGVPGVSEKEAAIRGGLASLIFGGDIPAAIAGVKPAVQAAKSAPAALRTTALFAPEGNVASRNLSRVIDPQDIEGVVRAADDIVKNAAGDTAQSFLRTAKTLGREIKEGVGTATNPENLKMIRAIAKEVLDRGAVGKIKTVAGRLADEATMALRKNPQVAQALDESKASFRKKELGQTAKKYGKRAAAAAALLGGGAGLVNLIR